MRNNLRLNPILRGVLGVSLAVGVLAMPASPIAQTVAVKETILQVERTLQRLPYYGVFDFLAFGLDKGIVTIKGYAYNATTRSQAASMVKRVSGVDDVVNHIELLPVSQLDDRIRWTTFYRIYTDDFLSRYSPGGAMGARYEAATFRRFPGMQPLGTYPIHIIVKHRKTTLVGIVDNESDKILAAMRAREVGSVAGVENELMLVKK